MTRAILTTLAAALLCASCGGDSGTSPTTTTETSRSTENFSGTLALFGSQFYSFTVTTSGTTDITLLSLTPAGAATPALTSEVGLGIGTPAGTGCALSSAATVRPALITQLSTTTAPTIYCVNISDLGNLADSVKFTIRIVHP
jgi:hypothetical protein